MSREGVGFLCLQDCPHSVDEFVYNPIAIRFYHSGNTGSRVNGCAALARP
jgi:hypothetical protein